MRFATHIIIPAAIAMLITSPLLAQEQDSGSSPSQKSLITLCSDVKNCDDSVAPSCCGDSCVKDCDSCCFEPNWEFRGGLLLLRRDLRGSAGVASDGAAILTNMRQFDSNYRAGFELNARRRLPNLVAELNYFQVDSFNAAVAGTSGLFGGFVNGYGSDLYNFEANFLTDSGSPFRLLAGFRYIGYNETSGLFAPAIPLVSSFTANNDLLGGQIGGELDLYPFNRYTGNFHLRAFSKFGVYDQDTSVNARLVVGGVNIPVAGNSANSTVLSSEAGITGGIQVTPALTLDGGYRLLYLDGVATAGDSGNASNFVGGTTAINGGHVLFHGFNFSATLTY